MTELNKSIPVGLRQETDNMEPARANRENWSWEASSCMVESWSRSLRVDEVRRGGGGLYFVTGCFQMNIYAIILELRSIIADQHPGLISQEDTLALAQAQAAPVTLVQQYLLCRRPCQNQ